MARIVVLGRSGSGKSYYSGFLLEQSVPEFKYAVHFDREDEEKGLSDANHDPLYRTLYVDPERYQSLNFLKVLYRHRKIRVVPEGLTTDEERDLFGLLCQAAMTLCQEADPDGTCFMSVDEAHTLIPNAGMDDRVERLITGGRKHGVEFLAISQRPQLLHKTAISQADRRVYFAITESNDINKVDKASTFDAKRLKNLPKRKCIVENKDSGEWTEVETDGIGRERPHYSGDDGIVDEVLPV